MSGIVARQVSSYRLTSREVGGAGSIVDCAGVRIGGQAVVLIAGPCTVEGLAMLEETGRAARAAGAVMLRGGAFKPRSSPYSFQGLGSQGLAYLARVRGQAGLPVVTEVMAPEQVELVLRYADMLQIGARNMQNYSLLREVGRTRAPVLLKRGMSASIDEWLEAAEYLLAQGNTQVVLCERGIRTFETATRFTLDLSAIPVLRRRTHLPVIVDPSHASGQRHLVGPLALAAVAVGADGIIVETHPQPTSALCDGAQSLDLDELAGLRDAMARVAGAVGRTMHDPVLAQSLPALLGPRVGEGGGCQ